MAKPFIYLCELMRAYWITAVMDKIVNIFYVPVR